MENKFELDNIIKEEDENSRRYILKFSDGNTQETISLAGQGKIKEVAKV